MDRAVKLSDRKGEGNQPGKSGMRVVYIEGNKTKTTEMQTYLQGLHTPPGPEGAGWVSRCRFCALDLSVAPGGQEPEDVLSLFLGRREASMTGLLNGTVEK